MLILLTIASLRRKYQLCARSVLLPTVLTTACAVQRPQVMHMEQLGAEPAHDEILVRDRIIDIYPNREQPHREVIRNTQTSCIQDFTCLNSTCADKEGTYYGCTPLPDGEYRATQTDDPRIFVLRDEDSETILKYSAINVNDWSNHYFDTLPEAQAYEHRGETTIKVLKVAGIVLLAGVVVAGAAAAGAAAAHNSAPVTTTCRTNPITRITTCSSF
jgi:hypothetical protein